MCIRKILYRYWAQGELQRGITLAQQFLTIVPDVLPVTRTDIAHALLLSRQYPALPPRDLMHIAVMLNNGVEVIVSADAHFDEAPGIQRMTPQAFASR